jgi:hypothetical protein
LGSGDAGEREEWRPVQHWTVVVVLQVRTRGECEAPDIEQDERLGYVCRFAFDVWFAFPEGVGFVGVGSVIKCGSSGSEGV